jgi:hypothetical protein
VSDRMEALDADPVVTDAHVRLALDEWIDDWVAHGGSCATSAEFWEDGTLDRYRSAAAWWPTDAPATCALPTLSELCRSVTSRAGTATDVLTILWQRCVQWLEVEGRSTTNPNETKEDRRRRQVRESVARHRALTREAASKPRADRLRVLHAAYIAACRARKAAADAAHREATPTVEAARAAWEAAKAEVA